MSVGHLSAAVHLPAPQELREVLVGMVDRAVELSRALALVPSSRSVCSVATYADPTGAVRAVAVADRALTVHAGAALGLVPPEEALRLLASTVEDGVPIDAEIAENTEEIFNVLASAFNTDSATHVKLSGFHVAGSRLPEDVRLLCYSLGRREDLAVEVDGYGTGRLAVVLAP